MGQSLRSRKKLKPSGFDRKLMALAFIAIISVSGSYYVLTTHADSGGLTGAYGNPSSTPIVGQSYTGASRTTNTPAALMLAGPANSTGIHICLDDYLGLTADNTAVDASQCNGSSAQTWSDIGTVSIGTTVASAKIMVNGKCLQTYHNGTAVGTPVVIGSCVGSQSQTWRWNFQGTTQEIENTGSGLCLTDPNASAASGTQFILDTCTGSNAQMFESATPDSSGGNG